MTPKLPDFISFELDELKFPLAPSSPTLVRKRVDNVCAQVVHVGAWVWYWSEYFGVGLG